MIRRLYALRDAKMDEFNNPCVFASDAAAIRAFGDLVMKDKETLISLHPADFGFYFIGEMNVATGVITPVNPVLIANGSDFVKE